MNEVVFAEFEVDDEVVWKHEGEAEEIARPLAILLDCLKGEESGSVSF